MNKPLVSVLMPVYNDGSYLDDAINSVLNQSYTNFELIIVNDGSTDNTEEIINKYKNEKVQYFVNPSNIKLIKTLNKGVDLCTGKYIARMDADDICLPNRIEKQVDFLEKNTEYVLVGGQCVKINDQGERLKGTSNLSCCHDEILADLLFKSCPIVHPLVMIRRNILQEFSPVFDEEYLHAEDYDLWFRLAEKGKLANLTSVLLQYRVHSNQVTSQYNKANRDSTFKIKAKYLSQYFPHLKKDIIENYVYSTVYYNHNLNINEIALFLDFVKYIKQTNYFEYLKTYFSNLFSRFLIHPKEFNNTLYKIYQTRKGLGLEVDLTRYQKAKFRIKCIAGYRF
jgi:glycosyltransferase involved in cell wall biosynthesis